jgi:NhaP-type Na+/H+ or K+/H+ antiporter
MMIAHNTLHTLRQFGAALNLALTLVVAWQSYLFGEQLGGPFIGVVAAVNGAAMCSLLISGLVDRLTGENRP